MLTRAWYDIPCPYTSSSSHLVLLIHPLTIDITLLSIQGFERLSSILQGKDSNYDTDIFMPIFAAIHANTVDCRPYQGLVGADDTDLKDMAYRVVADHIRTLTFAITDGAVPSSEGRGYVLRRILRRAVRYGQEILNAPAGFFTKLVPVVVANFSDMFPELLLKKEFVMSVIADEETSFTRTLDQGVKHFNKVVNAMQASGSQMVPAKDAHMLFSSMGFPLDLTELMAAERGLSVDKEGFQAMMDNDRKISEAAENARKGAGSKDLTMEAEQTSWLQGQGVAITNSESKYTWHIKPSAKVVALFLGRGGAGAGFTETVSSEDGAIGVILDITSFYYESGGQIFDTGCLEDPVSGGTLFTVDNSQTYAGFVVHIGSLSPGSVPLKVGATVNVSVDYTRRALVAPNHTMTHVLNYALKTVLLGDNKAEGVTIDQKGSLVDAEKLRFDFTWNGALAAAQVARIEALVNAQIQQVIPLCSRIHILIPVLSNTTHSLNPPDQHTLNTPLTTHPLNTPAQRTLSTHSINPPSQPTLSTPRSMHPLNPPAQRTHSTHPLNAPSQRTLPTHPLNAPFQHTLSTRPFNPPLNASCFHRP